VAEDAGSSSAGEELLAAPSTRALIVREVVSEIVQIADQKLISYVRRPPPPPPVDARSERVSAESLRTKWDEERLTVTTRLI
jgi:hypothetical protein